MSISVNKSFGGFDFNSIGNTFGVKDKPKVEIPVTLVFSPADVNASGNPRKRPAQITLTENQIEAKIFEHFGLDAGKDSQTIKERLGSQANPFDQLKTTGTFTATYNQRTGNYEIISNIEAGLYKELQGTAAQVKADLETNSVNDKVAVKTKFDNAAVVRKQLEEKYNQTQKQENSVSASSKSDSDVKAVTDAIQTVTGTTNPFGASEVGRQMNRLGVSTLRLAGSAGELSVNIEEKIHDTVRDYLPDAVNDFLDQNQREKLDQAKSLQNAQTSLTSEDDLMDAKNRADGKSVPITEDLANKVMYFPEGIPNAIDSAIKGEFKDDDGSYSDTFGKIVGGLNPAGDIRDVIANGEKVIEGKPGAWVGLVGAGIGIVPLIGDGGKIVFKLERKAVTEGTEKLVGQGIEKEIAEKIAKEDVTKLVEEAGEKLIQKRQQFKQIFGETRYNEYAEKIEQVKMSRPELKDIATEDLVAIKGYTSRDYQKLNDALRSKDEAKLSVVEPYINVAESGLSQMPSFSGVVYRGVDLDNLPDVLSKYKVGQTVTEDAFTSSSVTKKASFRRDTLMIIRSKSGKDVSILSDYPKQKEILFKPGMRFKVESIIRDPNTGKRVINLREIE